MDGVRHLAGRHAQYRTDPDGQLVHARHPFVSTFDDHEVDNDWRSTFPQDPAVQTPPAWEARRAAAFQAFNEHMPLRRQSIARGASIRLYRRLQIADLVEFNVLDTRQYGSRSEPCGCGTGPACPEVFDPARTMLGEEQEHWLHSRLGRSRARWDIIASRSRSCGWTSVGDVKANFDDPESATIGREFIGDVDLLRWRRCSAERGGTDRAGGEPAHPLSQLPARLRALPRHRRALAHGLPHGAVRHSARRAPHDARKLRDPRRRPRSRTGGLITRYFAAASPLRR